MSSEKEFDINEWARETFDVEPGSIDEGLVLLIARLSFKKGQEQAAKRILEDCKKLATYVNNQLGAAYPAVSMEGIEDIIDKILKESK